MKLRLQLASVRWVHKRFLEEDEPTRYVSSLYGYGRCLLHHDAYWSISPEVCWRIWRAFQ